MYDRCEIPPVRRGPGTEIYHSQPKTLQALAIKWLFTSLMRRARRCTILGGELIPAEGNEYAEKIPGCVRWFAVIR
jgi:hypothetical protein